LATSVYDADNQLTSRQFTGNSGTLRVDYAYTNAGELSTTTRYSDLAGTTKVGDTLETYDSAGRLTNLENRDGTGTVLAYYTYTYDLTDRMTTKVENGTTTSYSYDADNQLIKDGGNATLTYDSTGNRTNTGYATGTGNQMSNDGARTYTYDAAGNVIKKSKGASAETWVYTYDVNNQLLTAKDEATDGGTLLGEVDYSYDVFGNRLSRTQFDGSMTTVAYDRFGYDGWDTAKPDPTGNENFDNWVDLNGSNALAARRIYGSGFDDLAASTTPRSASITTGPASTTRPTAASIPPIPWASMPAMRICMATWGMT
jgi:uncharacterized protein RhaS with RHS repeats